MTQNALRSALEHPRARAGPGRQCPSPWEAERLRPLSRGQVMDRLPELCEMYAANSGAEPCRWDLLRHTFLSRLTDDMRRPGFTLLVAENSTMTTACAYGFPLRAGLFAIREIVVRPQVRRQSTDRDWNLARRLQRRLLGEHADATGVTLVARFDVPTLAALRAWGWRDLPADEHRTHPADPRRVLYLDP
ncbi:hypothetical protein ACIQI8_30980 [Streptomyces sp. NPDC092369]|uniref:hypothetical protein n=1 Tax=Streptomyces sp. NPDC092369 TaxID=3366015 RepID=UPI00382E3125